MTLMLAIAHRTAELDRKIRQTDEIKIGVMNNLGISIYGKTLGIIGLGRIGQAVAKRALACGMRIIYHNRQRAKIAIEQAYEATYVSFDELLSQSDFISLHLPYYKESHHLINDAAFQKMKNGATLINTARGAVVDEKALIKNLKSGKLFGAALDVFEKEPVISPELFELDNVVLSPHIGTGTIDGRLAMCECVSQNILHFEKRQLDKIDWVNKF
jgi:lactate dehydrogenase-like 2-hydroxyacid dehydrogenase